MVEKSDEVVGGVKLGAWEQWGSLEGVCGLNDVLVISNVAFHEVTKSFVG